jgi:hypothetical protein
MMADMTPATTPTLELNNGTLELNNGTQMSAGRRAAGVGHSRAHGHPSAVERGERFVRHTLRAWIFNSLPASR